MANGENGIAALKRTDWIERAAIGASLLCMVHCLALPLLIAALPALSNLFALPETIHLWILVFAIPSALVALITGRARHGATWPVVIGVAGLILLAVGAIVLGATPGETPVTVAGSLALVFAHIGNWRLRHAHGHG